MGAFTVRVLRSNLRFDTQSRFGTLQSALHLAAYDTSTFAWNRH